MDVEFNDVTVLKYKVLLWIRIKLPGDLLMYLICIIQHHMSHLLTGQGTVSELHNIIMTD